MAARNPSHLVVPVTAAPLTAVAFTVKVPPAAGAKVRSPDPCDEGYFIDQARWAYPQDVGLTASGIDMVLGRWSLDLLGGARLR